MHTHTDAIKQTYALAPLPLTPRQPFFPAGAGLLPVLSAASCGRPLPKAALRPLPVLPVTTDTSDTSAAASVQCYAVRFGKEKTWTAYQVPPSPVAVSSSW